MKNCPTFCSREVSCDPCGGADRRAVRSSEGGYTILELLVAFAITTILATTAFSNLRSLERPLVNGTAEVVSFTKQARAKAMSTTFAYKVQPSSNRTLVTLRGNTCATATIADPSLTLNLPQTVTFSDATWSICFNPRGLADTSQTFNLTDSSRTKTIEVFLGGGVRAQ